MNAYINDNGTCFYKFRIEEMFFSGCDNNEISKLSVVRLCFNMVKDPLIVNVC